MKTQLALPGDTNPELEVERIRVVRECGGPNIDLMCDINQRWDVRQAISIGSRVEEYHLFWLEDVIAHDDYPGLASVAEALATPIAAGEYVYGLVPFRHMLEARSVDIVMVDVLRAGGISNRWQRGGTLDASGRFGLGTRTPYAQLSIVATSTNGNGAPTTLFAIAYYRWHGDLDPV